MLANLNTLLMRQVSIWRFLLLLAFMIALPSSLGAKSPIPPPEGGKETNLCSYTERIPSMGTVFEIQYLDICGKGEVLRQKLVLEVQTLLEEIEVSMSLYQSRSEISRLNAKGFLEKPSSVFLKVLKLALRESEKSEGYFDITILPLLNKIQDSFEAKNIPPPLKDLDALKALVDYHLVIVEDSKISFKKKGVKITLDGIAKGFAVDRVADLLLKTGLTNFLANFSGNMRAEGFRLKKEKWSIVVDNPTDSKKYISVDIQGAAVASSGLKYRYYSDDKKWGHLISPKDLRPATALAQASVMGKEAVICDALSTALFVMGTEKGKRIFAKNYPNYRFITIDLDGKVHKFP